MFAEWELIGVPVRVTVGDRGLATGQVELLNRRETEPELVELDQAINRIKAKLED
jgi:prolyl-tRNA synthetase